MKFSTFAGHAQTNSYILIISRAIPKICDTEQACFVSVHSAIPIIRNVDDENQYYQGQALTEF